MITTTPSTAVGRTRRPTIQHRRNQTCCPRPMGGNPLDPWRVVSGNPQQQTPSLPQVWRERPVSPTQQEYGRHRGRVAAAGAENDNPRRGRDQTQ